MKEVLLIANRELAAYLRAPLGYIVGAVVLFVVGILFNGWAMSATALSADILREFFRLMSGTVMIASIVLTMRLFAEERVSGTMVLLQTAPIREWQVVFGKYLSAVALLAIILALSVYMPLMILVNGKISFGHVLAGYLGLLALGACTTAMGVFGSVMVRSQVLAAVLSGAIVITFLASWKLADITDAPISGALGYLALWDKHFWPSFTRGVVSVKDVFFFAALSFVFLAGTSKVLAARRWVG